MHAVLTSFVRCNVGALFYFLFLILIVDHIFKTHFLKLVVWAAVWNRKQTKEVEKYEVTGDPNIYFSLFFLGNSYLYNHDKNNNNNNHVMKEREREKIKITNRCMMGNNM